MDFHVPFRGLHVLSECNHVDIDLAKLWNIISGCVQEETLPISLLARYKECNKTS